MKPQIIWRSVLDSTNAALKKQTDAPTGTTIAAEFQEAGRGQRGNSWESEKGKNLLFSTLLRPKTITPERQFELSMVVSLAILDVLRAHGIDAKIKWPNDIYVEGDRKICGILIEHTVSGTSIEASVVGVGLNVNQKIFFSDAPNPISMIGLIGTSTPLQPLLEETVGKILDRFENYEKAPDSETVLSEYRKNLWRGDDRSYPFRDTLSGELFHARIGDIAPDGTLSLLPEGPDSSIRNYSFKEVEFIL